MEEKENIEIKEEKEVEIKDDIYRLQEMSDEMLKSIDNVKIVKEEQEYLVGRLEELKDERFEKLINGIKDQIENFERQIAIMTARQKLVSKVIEATNEENIKQVVNDLLEALGVFAE